MESRIEKLESQVQHMNKFLEAYYGTKAPKTVKLADLRDDLFDAGAVDRYNVMNALGQEDPAKVMAFVFLALKNPQNFFHASALVGMQELTPSGEDQAAQFLSSLLRQSSKGLVPFARALDAQALESMLKPAQTSFFSW